MSRALLLDRLHARSYEALAALPIRLSYVSTCAPALIGVVELRFTTVQVALVSRADL